MRGARSRLLSGVGVACLVAVSCSDDMSKSDGSLVVVAGQSGGGAGGAGTPATGLPGVGTGPANRGATAGASAPTAGAAGVAASPTAGAAGASNDAGSGGQAGSSSQAGAAGGVSAAGSGGAVGAAGAAGAAGSAGAGAAAGATDPNDPCPLMTYVNDGVPVRGAGCKEQWEGIVMTQGGRGLCTAAFITDRHLISASHCYARDGAVSVKVFAPTWGNNAAHTFQAQVKRSGSNMSLDISIIDLGEPVAWATPERRFVLHAGMAAAIDLHLYGFGSSSESGGGAGMLRGIPKRATIHVTDNGRGNLSGKAGEAQLCTGDSGGPAFAEKTAAVLYGINQAIVPGSGGGRTCAGPDWTIMFTNVSEYVSFIEQTIGKPCERKRVDDLDVAKCG